jgi:hypothetical protein
MRSGPHGRREEAEASGGERKRARTSARARCIRCSVVAELSLRTFLHASSHVFDASSLEYENAASRNSGSDCSIISACATVPLCDERGARG